MIHRVAGVGEKARNWEFTLFEQESLEQIVPTARTQHAVAERRRLDWKQSIRMTNIFRGAWLQEIKGLVFLKIRNIWSYDRITRARNWIWMYVVHLCRWRQESFWKICYSFHPCDEFPLLSMAAKIATFVTGTKWVASFCHYSNLSLFFFFFLFCQQLIHFWRLHFPSW